MQRTTDVGSNETAQMITVIIRIRPTIFPRARVRVAFRTVFLNCSCPRGLRGEGFRKTEYTGEPDVPPGLRRRGKNVSGTGHVRKTVTFKRAGPSYITRVAALAPVRRPDKTKPYVTRLTYSSATFHRTKDA